MFRFAAKPSEKLLEQEDTIFDEPKNESPEESVEPVLSTRFFDQLLVTILCLILLLLCMKTSHPRVQWFRMQLHNAFNASTESTFGILAHAKPVRELIRSSQKLVKLEEIAQPFWRDQNRPPETLGSASQSNNLVNAVWPVAGNVTRNFGWQYNPQSFAREFNTRIEITTQPGTTVHSIYSGDVIEIAREAASHGAGTSRTNVEWQVTMEHDTGWISIYHHLAQVQTQIGQKVPAGGALGILDATTAGNAILGLEVKHNGQPVDPMTLFIR